MKPADKNNNSGNIPPEEPPVTGYETGNTEETSGPPQDKRKKPWRSIFKFILYFFLVLILIPPSLGLLFNNPVVQSLSARLATSIFSNISGNKATIDAIEIDWRGRITLRGILLKDLRDNNMIRIDYLKANPAFVDWFVMGMVFSKLEFDGVEFRFARYKEDEDYNFRELINRPESEDTTGLNVKGPPFRLRSRKLILTNGMFNFYDEKTF